ncbi:MAG: phage tail assembly chaperone [Gallionella sp.]
MHDFLTSLPLLQQVIYALLGIFAVALALAFFPVKHRLLLLVFLVAGLVGVALATLWMLLCVLFAPSSPRAWHIAIALDQLANATTGGSEDETISSRAGRLKRDGRGWACVLCKLDAQLAATVRAERYRLLAANVDSINPVRYAEMSKEQRVKLGAYRQALLDVTKQSGFPHDVIFPTLEG